jgi:hypothetical protein
MKRIFFFSLALTALPLRAAPPPATPVETIVYETGPCFGRCPVYRVTIDSNGNGSFEGIRFTAVTGVRPFRAGPAQYRAFAARLEPIRPRQGSMRYEGAICGPMITDMPSAQVTWRSLRGAQSLYFYYGCAPQRNRAIAERLTSAPRLLPIGDFISAAR